MGGVLGRLGPQDALPMMNIHPDERQNNPNNPLSEQTRGFIIHGMMPLVGICFYAYTALQRDKDKIALEKVWQQKCKENEDALKIQLDKSEKEAQVCMISLTKNRESLKHTTEKADRFLEERNLCVVSAQKLSSNITSTIIDRLRKENEVFEVEKNILKQERDNAVAAAVEALSMLEKDDRHQEKFKSCEEIVNKIMDIRCSWFVSREERGPHQRELKKMFNDYDMWTGASKDVTRSLDEILTFVDLSVENRRILGRLYVGKWQSEAELQRYRGAAEKLKKRLREFKK